MVDITVNVAKSLPLDEFGVLGVGSFVWDYLTKDFPVTRSGNVLALGEGRAFSVVGDDGKELLHLKGEYKPDSKPSGWDLNIGEKHNSGHGLEKLVTTINPPQLIEVRPGGGIINLARAWLAHSGEVPFGICALRGKGKRSDILPGAFFYYVDAKEDNDVGNLVFPDRTIVRGTPLTFGNHLYFNPSFPFNIGTVIVNSLESAELTEAGIGYYCEQRSNGNYVAGIIAITPKMKESYGLIKDKAIPNLFIPVFSPTDLLSYVNATNPEAIPVKGVAESDITFSQIMESIKEIRKQQIDHPQRIYVSLGPYGAIGVGTNGTVYRTNVFNIGSGKNFTGAGDVFCSGVSRFEHRKNLSRREYIPVYQVLAYASAASAVHIEGNSPSRGLMFNKLASGGHLDYECLGNIDMIDTKSPLLNRKLSDVGNSPVSGIYYQLFFR